MAPVQMQRIPSRLDPGLRGVHPSEERFPSGTVTIDPALLLNLGGLIKVI